MKARVFHVITKLELGGAQKVTLMTLERLSSDHYEVGLVAGSQGLLVERARQIPGLRHFWIPELERPIRPLRDAVAFWRLWRIFRTEKPQIVHTHSSKAGILGRWAAWLAGVPNIFHTAHGFGFNDYQNPAVRALYVWIERASSWITTQTIVVSRANARRAEELGILRSGEWLLCRDAIEVDAFSRPGPYRRRLAEWGIPADSIVVGMVACFKPQKSPVDFVRLAARTLGKHDNVRFVMAGDGELRPEIEAAIQEAGISDRFSLLGWQHDMPEVYRNFDVFVLTSLWEGQPCVFAEAMASGLPIVATSADGASEAIADGETGFVCPPRDIDFLTRALERLVSNPDLRKSMGERARARAREFDIDVTVALLESAYRSRLKAPALAAAALDTPPGRV